MLGLARTVVEGVELEEASGVVVVSVRSSRGAAGRCGLCGRRASRYDHGQGRRRWRALDVGELRCYLQAEAPRVNCPVHGPTVVQVPWARHGVGHTHDFDDTVRGWPRRARRAVIEPIRF